MCIDTGDMKSLSKVETVISAAFVTHSTEDLYFVYPKLIRLKLKSLYSTKINLQR